MRKVYKKTCTFLLSMIGICAIVLVFYYTRTYTIIFDTRGAMPYDAKEIKPNNTIPKPADPVMEGYIFEGWVDENDNPYDFSTPVKENLTLLAKWRSII